MKKYKAFINDKNYKILDKGQKICCRFYTTLWFEAQNTEEAEQIAINFIKSDQSSIQGESKK